MTVYADILFIVNLYIDAMLLSAVRRFLRLPLTAPRWLLASALGGLFGLTALLPQLTPLADGLAESYAWFREHRELIRRKPLMAFIDANLMR